MLLCALPSFFPGIYFTQITKSILVNDVLFYLYALSIVPALYGSFKAVYAVLQPKYAETHDSDLIRQPLKELVAYTAFHAAFFLWSLYLDPTLFARKPYLVFGLYIFLNGNLTMWKMVAKNSGEKYPMMFMILTPLVLPIIAPLALDTPQYMLFNDYFLLCYFLSATFWHTTEYISLIRSFAAYLKLPIFSARKVSKKL
eukprot:TRINITY_DN8204_c0_g1_i2.p1 TRINITY_DN8204_c0_g1~~TRINITY_DN8204_c0_g1_i2.p1  ORF type:complete len:199 (+),score=9.54 TRINITY_DN8204_c0_g1_i2:227-823(+)